MGTLSVYVAILTRGPFSLTQDTQKPPVPCTRVFDTTLAPEQRFQPAAPQRSLGAAALHSLQAVHRTAPHQNHCALSPQRQRLLIHVVFTGQQTGQIDTLVIKVQSLIFLFSENSNGIPRGFNMGLP